MFESPAEMVATMASVASVDIALLDADGLLEHLSTIQQLESALAARKAETMVAFHYALSGTSADLGHESPRPGDRPAGPTERRWSGDVLRSVTDELGLTLSAHRKTAALWLNRAAVLVDRFPTTLRLLGVGGIPVAAAQHIARELALIVDDDLRAAVEAIVLAWGRRYGWRRIKKTAQRETQKVLAEYESLLHAQRQDERTTYTVTHNGGTSDLVVSTSAIDITAIMAALTLRARQLRRDGDPRNLNQLRTDLAVNRLLGNDQTTTNPHTTTGNGEPASSATPNRHPSNTHPEPARNASPTADTHTSNVHHEPACNAGPTADAHTSDADAESAAGAEPEWYTAPSDAEPTESTSGDELVPAAGETTDVACVASPGAPRSDATAEAENASSDERRPATGDTSTNIDSAISSTADGETCATAYGGTSTDAWARSDREDALAAEAPVAAATTSSSMANTTAENVSSGDAADRFTDVGMGGVSVPPESGLNPAVAIQVVIHCTYAEAEALATGAICTGGELQGYGPLPQDALAMAFSRAKFR
ncbi:hypothetical protein, partial [Kribbella sp. NPDC006257]|uniref:hypothetical protein n=1 Tax=Kribbella sp. NPDC006257 TaxID=3156738 RepID=UPI0033B2D56A